MHQSPTPHPSAVRLRLRALAHVLSLSWVVGDREGAPVPGTPHRLIHRKAQDHGHGVVRELLTDGHTLFGLRIDTADFAPLAHATSQACLERALLERHLDALATASPHQARVMLGMVHCTNPGALAGLLAQAQRCPIGVSEDTTPLLWKILHFKS